MFGCPVEHSLSPAMHNAAIAALGLHYTYIPFSVRPDDIGPAIHSLTTLGIVGINLTIPHKERVLPFLDEVAAEARAIGAVNTVHNVDGRLVGYNTDGDGFAAPLARLGWIPSGGVAVLLGAGGAARSVAHRLAREGASVVLANRTLERARCLADEVNALAGRQAANALDAGDREALGAAVARADLLVNCTSVGMHPREDEMPDVPVQAFRAGLLVYDLIYNPPETALLRAARAAGAATLNGVQMLVHQGAAAFRIWTGMDPPVDVMERAVLAGLGGRNNGLKE